MNNKSKAAATLLGLAATLTTGPALAWEPGSLTVRLGPAWVLPNDHSTDLRLNGTVLSGMEVEVDNSVSLGITATYMISPNIGIGLLGAWPFSHDIKVNGGALDGADVADTKHLPPTLTLQYHFLPQGQIHPYIGAGLNYTIFFDSNTKNDVEDLGFNKIDLDNSWGLAAEAGVDIDIRDGWLANLSAWYVDIDTEAKLEDSAGNKITTKVNIDPWVLMFAVGKRF
jgi:outer membrane protein